MSGYGSCKSFQQALNLPIQLMNFQVEELGVFMHKIIDYSVLNLWNSRIRVVLGRFGKQVLSLQEPTLTFLF
jgi:hypothetical protein